MPKKNETLWQLMKTLIILLLFTGVSFAQRLETAKPSFTETTTTISTSKDFEYGFIHGVGSADSVVGYTPNVTQWVYTKINTSSAENGMSWHEADGITCAGDSITILKSGHYVIHFSITLSGTNQNDYWRIKAYKNGGGFPHPLGRFRWKSNGSGVTDTKTFFWYTDDTAVGDIITFAVTNETASRNPTIVDMKIYISKIPEK